ncbi:helix-turn-helix transcriptional regulator [Bradyrhizobium sp. INPA01-394B]|uniref:Helix-turn-helix transcriptional regulator n=1 Tax=Bradyrhizobium campsiandrae TaxID=1729892 RepID=A0ABR7TXM9_9BRAD|nr:helix-turn-helix transcriptional regulator [Bradyrhizobium campsiandrae]MBC9877383.1 helix-turn-helix transcriptional regulator [Bradyrhizobium campsiandrae]MBC9976673.1 helix-turn-helix transcriptional regulator [Bradyrhizobium campsiandrae]
MISDDELIDKIYEAALVPDLWSSTLQELADVVMAAGTGLFLLEGATPIGAVWSQGVYELGTGWMEGGWQAKTQRASRMMAFNHAGFVCDADVFSPEEMDQDEAIVRYLRPKGFGNGAGTGITMPTGNIAVYTIERRSATSPFSRADCVRLDSLRPHLARAALLSCRTGLARARAMADTLQAIGLPGGLVRTSGRLISSNQILEDMIPSVLQDGSDRLRLSDLRADELLHAALKDNTHHGARSIPVPGSETHPPLIVHLLPIRGAAHDFYLNAATIVIVTPVDRSKVPTAEVLQGLFDLTPAEARIARGIAGARNTDELAKSLGVSLQTVRTQVKAVLAKTGTRRQQELISLLAGKTYPRDA